MSGDIDEANSAIRGRNYGSTDWYRLLGHAAGTDRDERWTVVA